MSLLFVCLYWFWESITGNERYRCKSCRRTHSAIYRYAACKADNNTWIVKMLKEGCGIRGIARLLKIGVSTVVRRILFIARMLKKPFIASGQAYELDELCTYIQ